MNRDRMPETLIPPNQANKSHSIIIGLGRLMDNIERYRVSSLDQTI